MSRVGEADQVFSHTLEDGRVMEGTVTQAMAVCPVIGKMSVEQAQNLLEADQLAQEMMADGLKAMDEEVNNAQAPAEPKPKAPQSSSETSQAMADTHYDLTGLQRFANVVAQAQIQRPEVTEQPVAATTEAEVAIASTNQSLSINSKEQAEVLDNFVPDHQGQEANNHGAETGPAKDIPNMIEHARHEIIEPTEPQPPQPNQRKPEAGEHFLQAAIAHEQQRNASDQAVEPYALPLEPNVASRAITNQEELQTSEPQVTIMPEELELTLTEATEPAEPAPVLITGTEQQPRLAHTAEMLTEISADITALDEDMVETIAEPVQEILIAAYRTPDQVAEDESVPEDPVEFLVAELGELFEQREIDVSDDEFIEIIETLIAYKEQSEAVTNSEQPDIQATATAIHAEVTAPSAEMPDEVNFVVLEQLDNVLGTLVPEAAEKLLAPVEDALETVRRLATTPEIPSKQLKQVETEAVQALEQLFAEVGIEVKKDQLQNIVLLITDSDSSEQIFDEEDLDFGELSKLLGTSEAMRPIFTLKKLRRPLHSLLGRFTVHAYRLEQVRLQILQIAA